MTRAFLGTAIAVSGPILGCSGSGDAAEPSVSTDPGASDTIEGQGDMRCVRCHSGSTRDSVLAPFPLQ